MRHGRACALDRSGLIAGRAHVAASRTIVIAGAGIGGLTAALTLARAGFRARRAGAGRAAGGNRRRHPAFAQRHARADRSRPGRAAARRMSFAPEAIRDHRRRERQRHRAHPARRSGRAPLRRALLGDPSRRPAGGAARARCADNPDITLRLGTRVEDFAIHANGVTVEAPRRAGAARRAGHRADRRRRAVVDAARAGSATAAAALRAAAPPGARSCRQRARRTNSARPTAALARARRASGALSGERRAARSTSWRSSRDDWHEPGWSAAGAARRAAGAFRAVDWSRRRANADRDAGALAEMGAVRPRRRCAPWGQRTGHADRRCRPPDAAVSRAGRAPWRSRMRLCWRDCLARRPTISPARLRRYERMRRQPRRACAARGAAAIRGVYHLARATRLGAQSGAADGRRRRNCLRRYDWLYDWRTTPPAATVGRLPTKGKKFSEKRRMFETTIAGSLPKPAWLAEPNKLWPQWRLAGDELAQPRPTRRCSR